MSIPVVNDQDFQKTVAQDRLVVVKFGAPWCGPCKALGPLLERSAQEFPNVSFVEINVDQSPMLAAKFHIRSVPTLMAWKDGAVQWTKIGLPSSADLKNAISTLAA